MAKDFYNLREAAEAVGVGKDTMARYVQQEMVEAHKITLPSGYVRYRISHAELVRVFGIAEAPQSP